MRLWDHSAEELELIPIPDLALLVLADFKAKNGWNLRNWVLEAEQGHGAPVGTGRVKARLAEAWAWLDSHGFVARQFDQSSPEARFVTEEGNRALKLGLARLHAARRLEVDLLPELGKARRQFLAGDYEEAVFASFRTVEETVRAKAGAGAGDLGVKLMREAFHKETGALTDERAEAGEREAMSALFAGAIGVFKNPVSHRTVDYDDPMLAAEAVLLADLLLRILQRLSD